MLVLVKANIFAVGLKDRKQILERLSARVRHMETGREAGRSLKNEKADSIISCWELADGPDGKFLKALRNAKPYLTIIVVVEAGNVSQEIAARSIGAAAVLSSDLSDEAFGRTVCQVLGLDDVVETEQKLNVTADGSRG